MRTTFRFAVAFLICLTATRLRAAGLTDYIDDKAIFAGEVDTRTVDFDAVEKWVVETMKAAEMLPAEREWVRGLYAALAPHMVSRTYVNALDEDHSDVAAAYGTEKYKRLAQIKGVYDPNNVFRRNANIKPAAQDSA